MHLFTAFTSFGLMAGAALAAPYSHLSRGATAGQNVVYWGQNGGGTIENNDLSAYCTTTSGIDVIVLAFLYQYGNGVTIPSGGLGQSCTISTAGEAQNCANVISSIAKCQSLGIKVILSLGGAVGGYSLTSQTEAEHIGQYLWDSYGNSGNTAVARPFGDLFVNGWDFDIEVNKGSDYYQYLISTLRSNFAKDPKNTYYITGAPQCPIPEPNMGEIIATSQFDYLFVQFYNNNNYTYPCALGFNGDAASNYNQWVANITGGPSKNAKIFIGVPAAPLAANGAPSGEEYYITPTQLSTLVSEYKTDSHFGGIMLWSAGFSDSNVENGCTYAQEAHAILVSGAPCGSGPVTSSVTAPSGPTSTFTTVATTTTGGGSTSTTGTATTSGGSTSTTATATTSGGSTSTTGIAQWGQCGGNGYTGSTVCIAPYTCTCTGAFWCQCQ